MHGRYRAYRIVGEMTQHILIFNSEIFCSTQCKKRHQKISKWLIDVGIKVTYKICRLRSKFWHFSVPGYSQVITFCNIRQLVCIYHEKLCWRSMIVFNLWSMPFRMCWFQNIILESSGLPYPLPLPLIKKHNFVIFQHLFIYLFSAGMFPWCKHARSAHTMSC